MEIIQLTTRGDASNSYLLVSGTGSAAVDPSGDPDEAVSAASGRGTEIKYIILTHGHFDHLLSLGELREKTGAPVLIGTRDRDFLTDPELSLFCQAMGLRTVFTPADRLLSDGDEIKIGEEKLTVLSTPGHTPGSCSFMFDGGLITGDTLFDMSVGRCDFHGGNESDLRSSLGKLAQLDRDLMIYPGHGPTSTLERQIIFNPFMNGEL